MLSCLAITTQHATIAVVLHNKLLGQNVTNRKRELLAPRMLAKLQTYMYKYTHAHTDTHTHNNHNFRGQALIHILQTYHVHSTYSI